MISIHLQALRSIGFMDVIKDFENNNLGVPGSVERSAAIQLYYLVLPIVFFEETPNPPACRHLLINLVQTKGESHPSIAVFNKAICERLQLAEFCLFVSSSVSDHYANQLRALPYAILYSMHAAHFGLSALGKADNHPCFNSSSN